MFSTVRIEGYRGLRQFEMSGLGRVNLLVGKNNCGKTSVLEALFLLLRRGEIEALRQIVERRGEQPKVGASADVSHLFFEHKCPPGTYFEIGTMNGEERHLYISVFEKRDEPSEEPQPFLGISGRPSPNRAYLPFSADGGLSMDTTAKEAFVKRQLSGQEAVEALFLSAEASSAGQLVSMWNSLVLTPGEELVLRALRLVEPDIERIAADAPIPWAPSSRLGFKVKMKGVDQPLPIGSMGDGMWRMLAISIAITQCRGGVLLIDEIDTGLHYSVLSKMWKLIYRTAEDLDVQVFATTHSQDCIRSFAELAEESPQNTSISIQRIVQGKPKAVAYTPEEVAVLANQDIEVR